MIFAIDPGIVIGWAQLNDDDSVVCGTWHLTGDTLGDKLWQLALTLDRKLGDGNCELIAYEQPQIFRSSSAARATLGCEAIITSCAARHGVRCEHIGPSSLKKRATGSGRAGKSEMITTARRHYPTVTIRTDHEADAVWVLDWATKGEAR